MMLRRRRHPSPLLGPPVLEVFEGQEIRADVFRGGLVVGWESGVYHFDVDSSMWNELPLPAGVSSVNEWFCKGGRVFCSCRGTRRYVLDTSRMDWTELSSLHKVSDPSVHVVPSRSRRVCSVSPLGNLLQHEISSSDSKTWMIAKSGYLNLPAKLGLGREHKLRAVVAEDPDASCLYALVQCRDTGHVTVWKGIQPPDTNWTSRMLWNGSCSGKERRPVNLEELAWCKVGDCPVRVGIERKLTLGSLNGEQSEIRSPTLLRVVKPWDGTRLVVEVDAKAIVHVVHDWVEKKYIW